MMAALLGLLAPAAAPAQAGAPRENELKAVFLFNFAQFVEWPAGAFATPDAPLVIGVLGDDPFDGVLDSTIQGERINNHPLVVERYRRVEDVGTCHILFISRPDAEHLDQVLPRLRDRSILTVGDAGNFSRAGGMIAFVTEHNRIRLRINLTAATAANLVLSSKLLRPAEIVGGGH